MNEEDDVLASLGTRRAQTSTYESDVIRQATYQLAPTLALDDSTGTVGFPDLLSTPLLPFPVQGQAKANRQVVTKMLTKLQSQFQHQHNNNNSGNPEELRVMAMKQQMLLSMLGTHSKRPPVQKCWKEQEQVEEMYKLQAQSTSITAHHHNRKARVPMQQRKQIPGAAKVAKMSSQQTTTTSSSTLNNRKKQKKWKDWSDSEDSISSDEDNVLREMNASRRRRSSEKISAKKSSVNNNIKRPAKQKSAAVPSAKSTTRSRERSRQINNATMQQPVVGRVTRKRTQVQSYAEPKEHDDEDNDTYDEMEFDESENKEADYDDQVDDGEANTTDDPMVQDDVKVKQEEDDDDETNGVQLMQEEEEVTNDLPSAGQVSCPLCQKTWNVSDASKVDTELAEHMGQCQTGGHSTRRSSRRQKQTPSTYKEFDENDDANEETVVRSTRGSRRKRSSAAMVIGEQSTPARKRKIRLESDENNTEDDDPEDDDRKPAAFSEQDEEFLFDDEIDEDEELEAEVEVEPELSQPQAIDDYRLEDYEDRVDYWRLYGVQEMRDLSKLKAEGEINPGEVTLEGGLHIPAWMNDRLFGYQRTGLEWMWQLHQQEAGGVIGDEMGLGKTVQVSSFLGAMAESRMIKSVLIISPATMLRHWLSELATWAPGLRRVLLHSSGDSNSSSLDVTSRNITNHGPAILRNLRKWLKRARRDRLNERIDANDNEEGEESFCGTGYVVITTYEHVRRNQEMYVNHPWSYCVMDEAQKIRNPHADITMACKRLRTPHRLAMTGTPIQNDLRELWSLFDFVFPGRLGTLPAFEQEFADPIKRGGYSNASPVQVQLAYRYSVVLRDLIDPYLLRRLKSEVDEVNRMPGKTEHVLFCRLSKRQRRMYEAYLRSDTVSKIFKGSTLLFAAVTMLRKICNHPDLVISDPSDSALESFIRNGCVPENPLDSGEDEVDADVDDEAEIYDEDNLAERSGKFEVLAKILPLWKKQKHRVLIFCQWTKMLSIIQRFVQAQGWKFGRLDGKTNVASRQRLVDNFNSDTSYFGMLCTTRTGGVGLNLTGANKIILYDVDWNPQTDAQARERAWRFGQEKEVTVYRLCTAGTIEEKMYQRQIFKTALTNRVLQDPRQRRLFSQKDLHDLLTLQPDSGRAKVGGEELVETAGKLSKADKGGGSGYYNSSRTQVSEEDGETLRSVLKSKGLAGVFDHNFVDSSSSANKSASVREMEDKAKRIAKEAAKALKKSIETQKADDPFAPTWTGDTDSRFGGGGASGSSMIRGDVARTKPVAAGVQGSVTGPKSSGSLLASLRQQNAAVKTGGRRRPSVSGSDSGASSGQTHTKYTKMMVRIRNYVKNNSPKTDELLQEFSNVPDEDAAIFRGLLTKVAMKAEDGRWQLQPDYR